MFSRHALLKQTLKPAFNYIKVDSAARIHSCCLQNLELTSQSSKLKRIKTCRSSTFSSVLQARHESSSSPASVRPSNESIAGLDPIPDPPSAVTSAAPTDVTTAVQSLGHEPSFSELGLGGWTPVGMVQNCMEFFHLDLGLPWWQAVVCGTVIIRLLMFPVVIKGQQNLAKMNNNMPEMQYIQARITDARQRGDNIEAARYGSEMMKFMNEKEINPIKNLLPTLAQAPVFVSVFMGLRGMAYLPVESLKTGGILWFVDLTVRDQFYLLPILTSATLFCTMKIGADGSPTTNHLARYFMLCIPFIVMPFTFKFPGLILVYWSTSNFMSLIQVGILRIPKVRDYFNIPRLIRHDTAALPIQDKGFVGNIKEAWNNLKITSELQERERADRMAFLKAGREPIRKTYKYDPTKVKPIIQAKKSS